MGVDSSNYLCPWATCRRSSDSLHFMSTHRNENTFSAIMFCSSHTLLQRHEDLSRKCTKTLSFRPCWFILALDQHVCFPTSLFASSSTPSLRPVARKECHTASSFFSFRLYSIFCSMAFMSTMCMHSTVFAEHLTTILVDVHNQRLLPRASKFHQYLGSILRFKSRTRTDANHFAILNRTKIE